MRARRGASILVTIVCGLAVALTVAGPSVVAGQVVTPAVTPKVAVEPLVSPSLLKEACALLDDKQTRRIMSGAFETRLLIACGRREELGQVGSKPAYPTESIGGTDIPVNDRNGDTGPTRTQSETSLARSETNGVLCSAYNDSYHGVTQGTGFTGFSHSSDGGATWVDHGVIPAGGGGVSAGDPSNVWSRRDNTFYHESLHSDGIGLWSLGADCTSATWLHKVHVGNDDKALMAVDNNTGSPHYGRLYVAFLNAHNILIKLTHSDNGTTWSSPITLSAAGAQVQGAWPAVAPNGDVYVGWVRWSSDFTTIDIEMVRSTNGGGSFASVTDPMAGKTNPRDLNATLNCSRDALTGNIRYLPSPQIAVDASGNLHAVYSYDPDGSDNSGDDVNVYYRRSTDQGATWGTEIRLNDDATLTDQFFPALAVSNTGVIGVSWYDRRNDPSGNTLYQYYWTTSSNGGVSFAPSEPVSDVASPVVLDPYLATCYHGDYDTSVANGSTFYVQWSDDRNADADVFLDTRPLPACPATHPCLLFCISCDPAPCQPTGTCTSVDTGFHACKQSNGQIFSCSQSTTVHTSTCGCKCCDGTVCNTSAVSLVCQ
jgi:hypothetical protein